MLFLRHRLSLILYEGEYADSHKVEGTSIQAAVYTSYSNPRAAGRLDISEYVDYLRIPQVAHLPLPLYIFLPEHMML